jgi:transcriptional regulator with XRE-family HTH domain
MTTQQPTTAPEPFLKALNKAMKDSRLSLREVARRAAISPAFLSRLRNGERGLPADDLIAQLETALDIRPRGTLLYEAGRGDDAVRKVMRKEGALPLMRTLALLSKEQIAQVQKSAQRLADKHHKDSP